METLGECCREQTFAEAEKCNFSIHERVCGDIGVGMLALGRCCGGVPEGTSAWGVRAKNWGKVRDAKNFFCPSGRAIFYWKNI